MSKKLSEKKTVKLGDFDIAPDFENGGVYKSLRSSQIKHLKL